MDIQKFDGRLEGATAEAGAGLSGFWPQTTQGLGSKARVPVLAQTRLNCMFSGKALGLFRPSFLLCTKGVML